MAIVENESSVDGKAITGKATGEKGIGIYGDGKAVGVRGDGETWHGVTGLSKSTTGGAGVYGKNTARGTGVTGESDTWMGVYGKSVSTTGGAGVMGEANGTGVIGKSQTWMGVYGETESTTGGVGVWGEHKNGGVGVAGISEKEQGVGVLGKGQHLAGLFEGNVQVIGNILADGDIVLANADCAEDFSIVDADIVEPGTVMVVGDEGVLQQSEQAYDKRVAGVISGAGNYKPGIVLDKQHSLPNRKPIALLGKVYCKVDASYAAVEVGDLLTTAPTPGHAMKAIDPLKAFGAVIGKALRPLREGQGLVPILIALQ